MAANYTTCHARLQGRGMCSLRRMSPPGLLDGQRSCAGDHQSPAGSRPRVKNTSRAAQRVGGNHPGRVLFNAMLPKGMPYYNTQLRSSTGRRDLRLHEISAPRTIDLLDEMNQLGFAEHAERPVLATDDLITPPNKQKIIAWRKSR